MTFLVTGVALFVLGLIAGRAGRVLGTVLAVAPVVLWFVLLWVSCADGGDLSASESSALSAGLVIGLPAFMTGQNLAERSSTRRMTRSLERND